MGFTKLFMARADLAIEFLIAAGVGILAAKAVPSLVDNYAHCENQIGCRDKLDKTLPFSVIPPTTVTWMNRSLPSSTVIWTQTL